MLVFFTVGRAFYLIVKHKSITRTTTNTTYQDVFFLGGTGVTKNKRNNWYFRSLKKGRDKLHTHTHKHDTLKSALTKVSQNKST